MCCATPAFFCGGLFFNSHGHSQDNLFDCLITALNWANTSSFVTDQTSAALPAKTFWTDLACTCNCSPGRKVLFAALAAYYF